MRSFPLEKEGKEHWLQREERCCRVERKGYLVFFTAQISKECGNSKDGCGNINALILRWIGISSK
jgi:hypothetical protein